MRNKTHLFEYITTQMCTHTIEWAHSYNSIDFESTIEWKRDMDRKKGRERESNLNAQCTEYFMPY